MGAHVLGVDSVARSVDVARAHALRDPLAGRATYRACSAETLVAEGARFDGVLSLEVVEHTADVRSFVATLAALLEPRGLLLLSTINRTLRSYALGILAAEHLLKLVPPGTHDWSRFLSPEEVAGILLPHGLQAEHVAGMVYSPLEQAWALSGSTQVNWIAAFRLREEEGRRERGERDDLQQSLNPG